MTLASRTTKSPDAKGFEAAGHGQCQERHSPLSGGRTFPVSGALPIRRGQFETKRHAPPDKGLLHTARRDCAVTCEARMNRRQVADFWERQTLAAKQANDSSDILCLPSHWQPCRRYFLYLSIPTPSLDISCFLFLLGSLQASFHYSSIRKTFFFPFLFLF